MDTTEISKARARARRLARLGAHTHQQALDVVARQDGHANWGAMLEAARGGITTAAPLPDPVRAFVDHWRWREPLDGNDRAMLEDAIHGLHGVATAAAREEYVRDYEFLADAGAITPTARQRMLLADAARDWGETAPDLRDVERALTPARDATRGGMQLSEWITHRLRATAERASAAADGSTRSTFRATAANLAAAFDPEHAPHAENVRLAHCPLHPDERPSLAVGDGIYACMAGCDHASLTRLLLERLAHSVDGVDVTPA